MEEKLISKMIEFIDGDYSININNKFITAPNKSSLIAAKIIRLCLAKINTFSQDDEEYVSTITFDEYKMYVSDYEKKGLKFYRDLSKSIVGASGYEYFDPDTNKYDYAPLVSNVRSDLDNFNLEITFNIQRFRNILMIKDKKNFTNYHARHLIGLKSKTSISLFELLRNEYCLFLDQVKKGVKEINPLIEYVVLVIDLKELKEKLGLKDVYDNFKDFRIYVLEKAKIQLEALENIDIYFSYKTHNEKGSKKVAGVEFHIYKKAEKLTEENWKIEKDSHVNNTLKSFTDENFKGFKEYLKNKAKIFLPKDESQDNIDYYRNSNRTGHKGILVNYIEESIPDHLKTFEKWCKHNEP